MYKSKYRKGSASMQVWFVFSLIFSMIVAVFAMLNPGLVNINFFGMNYELSQSVVILASTGLGAGIAVFLSLFSKIKSGFKNRELTNKLEDIEKKNKWLNETIKKYEQEVSDNASKDSIENASGHLNENTEKAESKHDNSSQSEESSKE
jgi:uncharacterized integral membrane protein